MRTHLRTKWVIAIGMLAVCLIIFNDSCKKNDPPPEPPPPVPGVQDVFVQENMNILSDLEISSQQPMLAANLYWLLQRDELGGFIDWFNEAWGVYSAIEGFKNTAAENQQFAHIDSSLNNISSQLTAIQNQLNSLAQLIKVDVSDILAAVYTFGAPGNAGDVISTLWEPTIPTNINYFQYYSEKAHAHNSGSQADSVFINDTLKSQMHAFAAYCTNGVGAQPLATAVQTLADVGLGGGIYGKPACEKMANYIVSLNATTSILNQYMVMENYFLQLVTYQYQAIIIDINANQIVNPGLISSIVTTFDSTMAREVRSFLKAAEYMAVMYDYRNTAQWQSDQPYLYYGISPEKNTNTMMARAHFIANLFYQAIGIPYPVISGNIILPYYYNKGTGAVPLEDFDLLLNYFEVYSTTKTLYTSPIPYTYWDLGSNNVFNYDNQWNLFTYTSEPGVSWFSVPTPVQISGAPWRSLYPLNGSITPMFYNPMNPAKPSLVKTDSCILQFAYFSASWRWGYPAICFASGAKRYTVDPYDNVGSTSSECQCVEELSGIPFVQQFHSSQCKWEAGGSVGVSTGRGDFEYTASGTFNSYSSGQVYFTDALYWPISAGNNLSGINLYTQYAYNHNAGTTMHHYFFKIGTELIDGKCDISSYGWYNSNGSILKIQDSPSNNAGNGIVLTPLSQGKVYDIGFEVEMGVWEQKDNRSFTCITNTYQQPVFLGLATFTPL